jgi:hypothetical protein
MSPTKRTRVRHGQDYVHHERHILCTINRTLNVTHEEDRFSPWTERIRFTMNRTHHVYDEQDIYYYP